MSKINSGIIWAEPLTEEQLSDARKRVLENGEAIACIDHNKELCFLLPTNPQGIKDLAWNRAEELVFSGSSLQPQMYEYRKSDIDTYFLNQTWYSLISKTNELYENLTVLPFEVTPAPLAGLTVNLASDGDLLVTDFANNTSVLFIPAYVDNNKVTRIWDGALMSSDKLTYVNIPPTVTSIGVEAFGNCTNLTEIDLGNCEASVQIFFAGDSATTYSSFANLPALQKYSVAKHNKKYKSIDGVLFDISDRQRLVAYPAGRSDTSYTVPKNTNLSSGSFYCCNNLISINLPHGVNTDKSIFYHCDNLTDITTPLTRSEFTYSSYGTTYWWQPSDSSKTVTIHCSDGTLTATANAENGYIYN